MKKLLLLGALGMFLNQNASAQAFSEESSYVNVGYGFGNLTQSIFKIGEEEDYNYKYNGVGPLFLKYEYAVSEKIGFGVNIAYAQAQATYNYKTQYITDGSKLLVETLDWKSYSILARLNIHFGDNDRFDPYWGVGAGYRDAIWSGFNNDLQSDYDGTSLSTPFNVGFETTLGCRFLFTDNIGGYIEAGLAKAVVQFGLTAKF